MLVWQTDIQNEFPDLTQDKKYSLCLDLGREHEGVRESDLMWPLPLTSHWRKEGAIKRKTDFIIHTLFFCRYLLWHYVLLLKKKWGECSWKKKMKKMTSCLMKNLDVIQCQVAKNVGVGGGRERDRQLIVLRFSPKCATIQTWNTRNFIWSKFVQKRVCEMKT